MANCLGQWPDVFNKWWLHSRQNDSLMLQGEDRLLVSLMIKMGLRGTLCCCQIAKPALSRHAVWQTHKFLLQLPSPSENCQYCGKKKFLSLGPLFNAIHMLFSIFTPAPQGLANHFSLALTWSFFYICLEWENQELSNDNSSYCTSGPVIFEMSIFKLCELATNLALLATLISQQTSHRC